MIGASRDNAFRAHARRQPMLGPRCSSLRGPVNYCGQQTKKERKKGKGRKKKEKGRNAKVSSPNGMGREGIRISDGRFFIGTVQRPVFGGGVLVLYRSGVFYCPKTDRYQDYVFPSTSTLVSAIESDTKPVRGEGENRRDILFRSNGPRPVSEFAETFFAMKSPRLSKWRGRRKSRRGMDGLWRIRRGISGSK